MILKWRSFILAFLILTASLTACSPTPAPRFYKPWTYADLRMLGEAGTQNPALDLIALYTRRVDSEVQVRLDLLDLPSTTNYDLYIALDTGPGGEHRLPFGASSGFDWDFLVVLPASGDIQVYTPDPSNPSGLRPHSGMGVRIIRDPVVDTLTVSLSAAGLWRRLANWATNFRTGSLGEANFGVQAFLTQAGSLQVISSLGPARSDAVPPPPAKVLLAFWDSLSAYTPAQALRRWDGAHTGPLGGRHGLGNLLHAAHDTGTPLALLDMASPANLTALDYVGGLGLVQDMVASGLLILPQTLPGSSGSPGVETLLPGWAWQQAAAASRQAVLDFGLPASPFLYAPAGLPPAPTASGSNQNGGSFSASVRPDSGLTAFIPRPAGPSGLEAFPASRWQNRRIIFIPLPSASPAPEQVTADGPSLDVRRALVQTALQSAKQPDAPPLLVLGGDLPASTWGNPRLARISFQYLADHPWVEELSAPGLLALNPSASAASKPAVQLSEAQDLLPPLARPFQNLPANPLDIAAEQASLALLAPVYPGSSALAALRSPYANQVGALLEGARWATRPYSQATCSVDLDQDGQPECVLASPNLYAIFEPQSGTLAWAFTRDSQGVHQIVGVSSQLASGLSEPSTWNLKAGIFSDPQVLAGAFADSIGSNPIQGPYQVNLNGDVLSFASPDGSLRKTFQVSPNGLRVEYMTRSPITVVIPLTMDPWVRFYPGWSRRYQAIQTGNGWSWELRPSSSSAKQYIGINFAPFSPPGQSSIQAAQDRLKTVVLGPAGMSFYSFLDSLNFISIPEDPNREYSPGHYLPFPVGMAQASAQGSFTFEIVLSNIGE